MDDKNEHEKRAKKSKITKHLPEICKIGDTDVIKRIAEKNALL